MCRYGTAPHSGSVAPSYVCNGNTEQFALASAVTAVNIFLCKHEIINIFALVLLFCFLILFRKSSSKQINYPVSILAVSLFIFKLISRQGLMSTSSINIRNLFQYLNWTTMKPEIQLRLIVKNQMSKLCRYAECGVNLSNDVSDKLSIPLVRRSLVTLHYKGWLYCIS